MIEISLGLSYSNLSPTVILHSAFKIGKLSLLMKSNGFPSILLIKALNRDRVDKAIFGTYWIGNAD